MIKNCNFVGAGARKVEKIVYVPTLTLISPIFGVREKSKLYIFKKICLDTFKGTL